jgi:DUF4097 and DUF4098 domain-containing protein YvlB
MHTDGRGWKTKRFICVHPCLSVANLCFRSSQVDSRMLKAMHKLASFRQKNLSASEAVVLRRDLGIPLKLGSFLQKRISLPRGSAVGRCDLRQIFYRFYLIAAALLPLALSAQTLTREAHGLWVAAFTATEKAPPGTRLRVNAPGPVTLEAGVGSDLSYTVKIAVRARGESEARRILQAYAMRVVRRGDWLYLEPAATLGSASLTIRAPRLREASISAADGAVEANGIDGPLRVDAGAGSLKADRIRGDSTLTTGGGEIRVGQVEGALRCGTGSGPVTVKSVRGEAVIETGGGDIVAGEVEGPVRASTAAGTVRIGQAGSSVFAFTGGGAIHVGKAGGPVTARNLAGPVEVGSAAGVRCESGAGGVQLTQISGGLRVSTGAGNIVASLLSNLSDSFLETGKGDITVVIPSNIAVTIWAENQMADTMQRIVSEFPGIPVRVRGSEVVAEGRVNGGGPLLRISGGGGTIFIKRQ